MDETTILSLAIFGCFACVAVFLYQLGGSDQSRLRIRLMKQDASSGAAPTGILGTIALLLQFGQAASRPFLPTQVEKLSNTKRRLISAGIYLPAAANALYGFKAILLVVGLAGGYAASLKFGAPLLLIPGGGLFGIFAPILWLKHRIKMNQKELDYGLPDALDLMVVCVEAGLTVDAAMQRVGQELADVHPGISRELGICHMETRVGLTRVESLKNLGTRTCNPSLQSLAAMLAQAERFGTSIGQALRVHAESMRLARHNKAEELAAKTSVKLTFPLVLFIFPATFIVLMGPTVIQLLNSPLFKNN